MLERLMAVFIGQSSYFTGLFFIWLNFEKEGYLYVRKDIGLYRICKSI